MTVLEVIQAAAGYLAKNNVESPRLNAEHLLAHSLGMKRLDLYLEFDRPLSGAEREPLRRLVRERSEGCPLQHLLGTAEFFGRNFRSDARALIPRPETEQLMEILLPRCAGKSRALDSGTGSGVIACTLALECSYLAVDAVDISPDVLLLAKANAEELCAPITFYEGDLFPGTSARYDLIVANLPYIPSGEIPTLQREVRHDPLRALDGGITGLCLIERMITSAPQHILPGGLLALEIGHHQAPSVEKLLAAQNFRDSEVLKDYQGEQRFVLAHYG